MHVKKSVRGGVMGGVTGGMKIEESLCLKGSAPSDGRDGALSLESQQKSENVRFLSMSHAFFNTLYFQKCSLTGSSALSIWELTEISTTFLRVYWKDGVSMFLFSFFLRFVQNNRYLCIQVLANHLSGGAGMIFEGKTIQH